MTPDPASGRWLRALAFAAVLAVGVATCARRDPAPAPGQRIVSIGGPVTEIVYALGAGGRVVATDTSSVYPAQAGAPPRLGYQRSIAAEAVLAQNPDLVLASAEAGLPAAIAQLRAAGVPLAIIPAAMTPGEAAIRIRAVGDALHAGAAARALADQLIADTRAAQAAAHPGTRAVVIYARGAGTLMAVLLDEPTSALDLRHRQLVARLARRAAADGHAVAIVVHDLDLAVRAADRVVLLAGGRVLADGAPAAVLTPALIGRAFDVPDELAAEVTGDLARLFGATSSAPR